MWALKSHRAGRDSCLYGRKQADGSSRDVGLLFSLDGNLNVLPRKPEFTLVKHGKVKKWRKIWV